jgi:hypothetical protein
MAKSTDTNWALASTFSEIDTKQDCDKRQTNPAFWQEFTVSCAKKRAARRFTVGGSFCWARWREQAQKPYLNC